MYGNKSFIVGFSGSHASYRPNLTIMTYGTCAVQEAVILIDERAQGRAKSSCYQLPFQVISPWTIRTLSPNVFPEMLRVLFPLP